MTGVEEGVAIAALVGSVAASGYSIYQSATAKAPTMPKPLPTPKLPDTQSLAGSQQIADQNARSAGGTVLAEKNKKGSNGVPAINDGASTVRKSLLGS